MKEATIVVLAGQSNAVGVGHIACLPRHVSAEKIQEYEDGYDHIQINYYSHDKKSNGFVKTTMGCTECTKHTVGPEVGLAEWFTECYPGRELFIVKCAYGATALWRDWLSPSSGGDYDPTAYADQTDDVIRSLMQGIPLRAGWCYNELVKLLRESIRHLTEQGYTPRICGFCWMQGEGDADIDPHLREYAGRYHHLLTDLSHTFSDYMADCIFVDGGISEVWPLYREMNEVKAAYAATHKNCRFIDTVANGLTTRNEPLGEPDIYHYDSDAILKLGRLFGEALASESAFTEAEHRQKTVDVLQ